MAASEDLLGMLHELQTKRLIAILEGDEPPTAAELAAINAFLRQNNISCAPATDNAVGELESKLNARRAKRGVPASFEDFDLAKDQMDFLN